jgi:hypothetical protein
MTVHDPDGRPDIERPIDLTDLPVSGPTPEYHPAEGPLPGDEPDSPPPDPSDPPKL